MDIRAPKPGGKPVETVFNSQPSIPKQCEGKASMEVAIQTLAAGVHVSDVVWIPGLVVEDSSSGNLKSEMSKKSKTVWSHVS